jgi:hypothetical protein
VDDAASRDIEAFWKAVQSHRPALERLDTADDPAYDAVLAALQEIDPGLFLEFSTSPGDHELVVTADGNRALFPLVDRVVRRAPSMDGWTIHALKPKRGFPETTTWEGFTIRPSEVVFDPLMSKEDSQLAIRLYVPELDPARLKDAHNALLRAIDSGLGERAFAERIADTFVSPLSPEAKAEDFIPLLRLEGFLDWRDRKARGS